MMIHFIRVDRILYIWWWWYCSVFCCYSVFCYFVLQVTSVDTFIPVQSVHSHCIRRYIHFRPWWPWWCITWSTCPITIASRKQRVPAFPYLRTIAKRFLFAFRFDADRRWTALGSALSDDVRHSCDLYAFVDILTFVAFIFVTVVVWWSMIHSHCYHLVFLFIDLRYFSTLLFDVSWPLSLHCYLYCLFTFSVLCFLVMMIWPWALVW